MEIKWYRALSFHKHIVLETVLLLTQNRNGMKVAINNRVNSCCRWILWCLSIHILTTISSYKINKREQKRINWKNSNDNRCVAYRVHRNVRWYRWVVWSKNGTVYLFYDCIGLCVRLCRIGANTRRLACNICTLRCTYCREFRTIIFVVNRSADAIHHSFVTMCSAECCVDAIQTVTCVWMLVRPMINHIVRFPFPVATASIYLDFHDNRVFEPMCLSQRPCNTPNVELLTEHLLIFVLSLESPRVDLLSQEHVHEYWQCAHVAC